MYIYMYMYVYMYIYICIYVCTSRDNVSSKDPQSLNYIFPYCVSSEITMLSVSLNYKF